MEVTGEGLRESADLGDFWMDLSISYQCGSMRVRMNCFIGGGKYFRENLKLMARGLTNVLMAKILTAKSVNSLICLTFLRSY